jgi:hypothetical protein
MTSHVAGLTRRRLDWMRHNILTTVVKFGVPNGVPKLPTEVTLRDFSCVDAGVKAWDEPTKRLGSTYGISRQRTHQIVRAYRDKA